MTRYVNRREALAGAGTVSLAALLAACGEDEESPAQTDAATQTDDSTTKHAGETADAFEDAPSCTLTPEQTEGPYYFDVDKIRGDIREDKDGANLRLAIRVRDAEECEPIRNAVVDIWHCDAIGSYSGFNEEGTFLRGAQVTNSEGIVEFTTIYPGWYMGRTIHIHAKVHIDNTTALTTQLYFDEDVTAAVYEQEPYSSRTGRDTFNDGDGIYDERTLLRLSRDGTGYLGVMNFDVEPAS